MPPFILAPPPGVATFGPLEQVFDVIPLEVREIAGVVLPCVHNPDRNQTAAGREARFLDALSGDKYRAIIGKGEMRVPADLPQVAVRVGEITTVPAPKDILSRLDDLPARFCG
jgi:hypothetical protein